MKIFRYIFILIALLFLVACGGNNSTNTAKDRAIEKAKAYAKSKGTTDIPTLQDFIDAEVIGVTDANIADINQVISNLTPEEVDTTEEIQTIANQLGVTVPTDIVSGKPNPSPSTPVTPTVTTKKDTIAPNIVLLGNNPLTLSAGSPYIEPNATATDNTDGNISNHIIITGNVNSSILGTYTITYTVTDAAGNSTTKDRIIKVIDTTKPTITLNGLSTMTVPLHGTYNELNATALDNIDGDISSKIVISGQVDTSYIVSNHYLSYTVTDSSGNTSTRRRRVDVVRFIRDAAKQTVVDYQTSLMWQDISSIVTARATLYNASASCHNSLLGGFTNWRLPTKQELSKLRVNNRRNLNLDKEFKYMQDYPFWSITMYGGGTYNRFAFSFRKNAVRLVSPNQQYAYRCVRNN